MHKIKRRHHSNARFNCEGFHAEKNKAWRARWADHPAEAARGAADAALFIDATRTVSMVGKETVWEDPC